MTHGTRYQSVSQQEGPPGGAPMDYVLGDEEEETTTYPDYPERPKEVYRERSRYRRRTREETEPVAAPPLDVDSENVQHLRHLKNTSKGDTQNRYWSDSSLWKPWGWKTGMLIPMYTAFSILGFPLILALLLVDAGIDSTWTNIKWSVDGFEEFSNKYSAILIIVPTSIGSSGLIVALLTAFWFYQNMYRFYKYGVDYIRVIDAIVPGIGYTWLIATLCGMTNLTELLLITFVFIMAHLQMATAEYYAYNERMTLGMTGTGVMTWCGAFLAFAMIGVLLPLGFTHGTHYHSAGAIIALSFYLTNLAMDVMCSAKVVMGTNSEGILTDLEVSQEATEADAVGKKKCIVKGGRTGLFSDRYSEMVKKGTTITKADGYFLAAWDAHIRKLVVCNNLRLLATFSCRWAMVICFLATKVFEKKEQVVY